MPKSVEFHKRPSAFTKHVGIETLKGGRECRLRIARCHANAMGYCHGGAIFTLADRAFSCAVNRNGKTAVAMEMKINYLLPVKVGDILVAKSRILKEGRSTTVCMIDVMRGRDLAAVVLATGYNVSSNGK